MMRASLHPSDTPICVSGKCVCSERLRSALTKKLPDSLGCKLVESLPLMHRPSLALAQLSLCTVTLQSTTALFVLRRIELSCLLALCLQPDKSLLHGPGLTTLARSFSV